MGINFPASPTVGQKYPEPPVGGLPVYTWDGEKWTTVGGSIAAYALPSTTLPLMDAASGAVGVATTYARGDHVHPADATALAYSGMQINGGMEISQELGQTGTTAVGGYVCDGWQITLSGTMTIRGSQQDVSIVPGFKSHLVVSVTGAQTTIGAGDYAIIYQSIEGYRMARLAWGTANAQPITLSFWSRHPIAGVWTGVIRNSAATRTYAFTYTQVAANVAQYNTITIPGDTGGTWATDNTTGMNIVFSIAAGSLSIAPAANTWWYAGNYLASPGQVNGVAATSYYTAITGVTVLPGTQAPTAAQSPNIMRPYDQELLTCMRYYARPPDYVGLGLAVTSISAGGGVQFPITMRATPTMLGSFSTNTGALGNPLFFGISSFGFGVFNGDNNWTLNAQVSLNYNAAARL